MRSEPGAKPSVGRSNDGQPKPRRSGSLSQGGLSEIGILLATIGAPTLLFGLPAGALADRWDRRRTMLVADLLRMVLVLSIPLLARIDIAWVYVVSFLLTTVSLVFRPAKQSAIPAIVPEAQLQRANAFTSATETCADLLGYPIAGALVGGLVGLLHTETGIALAFTIDAATYLFSALMIARMAIPGQARTTAEQASNLLRTIREGVQVVRNTPTLLANLLLIVCAACLFGGEASLTFGYAMEVTQTGGMGYAILEAALGLGSLVGAWAVERWGGRFRKGQLILAGVVLMGLFDAGLALTANLWLAATIVTLSGFANMLFVIPSVTLTQECTPDGYLGRVFSLRATAIGLAVIGSNLVLGFSADMLGIQPLFAVSGGLMVLLGLAGACFPSLRAAA